MSTSPYLRTLRPIDVNAANAAQHQLLTQARQQVGFIPNMYASMVNAPGVLSTYLHGYTLFRQESGFQPVEQEVVFLAISMTNNCDYCVAAHSMIADKVSRMPADVLTAIRSRAPIPDLRLAALYAMTSEIVSTHGQPQPDTVQAFLQTGFTELNVLYIILAAGVKTLSNFSNHAFGTTLDERFKNHSLE
jgi:AhpD family alkylhydroperoxidase